jgi:signal transduction histidine kinase
MILTLLILGLVIRTDTETTIASFSQSGGFYGADRVITQYAQYYAENGSWDGITINVAAENPSEGWDGTGSGRGKGGGGGGSRQDGSGSAMGFSNQDQFSLTNLDGVVLLSTSLTIGDTLSEDVLENGFEILVENEVVGYLFPEANLLDLSDVISEKLSTSLSDSLLPTALIAGAAAIVLSIILAAFLMNPIRQLTKAANRVASGDLSQRVPVSGRDEISQLAESFNQMADSLENAQSSRQAMTADIAHELRTPLSIQRANLEAFQDGIYPLTLENLDPIIQQNNMLTKLVEDLRTLALADAGGLQLEQVSTDLNGLIDRICEDFQARYNEAGIVLSSKTDPLCPTCQIDPSRMSQVFYNLLHNSLRHTPEGGRVEITSTCAGGSVTINIRDTGEGIPEDDLPHLFDRFYRSGQSRARHKGGSGLGLTIAQQIVHAHQGRLTAANHPEGGAIFTIQLPEEPE